MIEKPVILCKYRNGTCLESVTERQMRRESPLPSIELPRKAQESHTRVRLSRASWSSPGRQGREITEDSGIDRGKVCADGERPGIWQRAPAGDAAARCVLKPWGRSEPPRSS